MGLDRYKSIKDFYEYNLASGVIERFLWIICNDSSYTFVVDTHDIIGYLAVPVSHPLCGYTSETTGMPIQNYEIPKPNKYRLYGNWMSSIITPSEYIWFPSEIFPWGFRINRGILTGLSSTLSDIVDTLIILAKALDNEQYD